MGRYIAFQSSSHNTSPTLEPLLKLLEFDLIVRCCWDCAYAVASTAIHRPSSIFFPHLIHVFALRFLVRDRGLETTDGPLFVRSRGEGIARVADPLVEGSVAECLALVGVVGPSSSTVSIGSFSALGRDPADLDILRELVPGFTVDRADEESSDKRVVDVVSVLKRLFSSSGNEGDVYEELDDAADIL